MMSPAILAYRNKFKVAHTRLVVCRLGNLELGKHAYWEGHNSPSFSAHHGLLSYQVFVPSGDTGLV